MAKGGTVKAYSIEHENHIARQLGGERTSNSGATDKQPGDVDRVFVTDLQALVECKLTGDPVKGAKSISIKLADLEKITDEANTIGAAPMLAARITNSDSPIADERGHVDWVMVPLADLEYLLDVARTIPG